MLNRDHIRNLAHSHGTTMKAVARYMGISASSLSQRLAGNPSLDWLERLAAGIGCDVSELLMDNTSQNAIVCPHCGRRIVLNVSAE